MFIDSTAFLAILKRERGHVALLTRLKLEQRKNLTSPLVRLAVVSDLCASRRPREHGEKCSHSETQKANKIFDRALKLLNCTEIMVTPKAAQLASFFVADFDLPADSAISAALAVTSGSDILTTDHSLVRLPFRPQSQSEEAYGDADLTASLPS